MLIVQLLGLGAAMVGAYWLGRARGSRRRPYWAAPPTAGHVVEVFASGGLVLWQSVTARETADSIADRWSLPGYAVVRYGPGDRVKDIAHGGDLLEEWESVWPIDPPEGVAPGSW